MKKSLGKESKCDRGADTVVGKTRIRMRNDRIWEVNSVAEASNKFREKRLHWNEYVTRREEINVVKRALVMQVVRRKGRPRNRWRTALATTFGRHEG